MCLNRVETANSLCIVQPFSPCLFQQDDLPGPNLFLQFWRKQLTSKETYDQWHHENRRKKRQSITWPSKMPLFCRGCSDASNAEVRIPLQEFPLTNKTRIFETLISEGMERFCFGCRKSGRLKVPDNTADESSEESQTHKEVSENEKPIKCKTCGNYLSRASFDTEKFDLWKKNWHLGRDAVCLVCRAEHAPIKCTICLDEKDHTSFDAVMLERWRKNRDKTKRAYCKDCARKGGKTTQAPRKRRWLQERYKCCISPLI